MIKKIKLLGHLGRKFGKEYSMDVSSSAEAVRALCSQINGFKQYMTSGKGATQRFKVIVGDEVIDFKKQAVMVTDNDISIVPVISGSGGKVLGAAMIVVGAILIYASWGTASAQGYGMMAAGVGLMVGGAMAFFMKTNSSSPRESNSSNDRSYLFGGAVNTTQQGQPIPVGYGRMRIGSQVISASISTVQVPI